MPSAITAPDLYPQQCGHTDQSTSLLLFPYPFQTHAQTAARCWVETFRPRQTSNLNQSAATQRTRQRYILQLWSPTTNTWNPAQVKLTADIILLYRVQDTTSLQFNLPFIVPLDLLGQTGHSLRLFLRNPHSAHLPTHNEPSTIPASTPSIPSIPSIPTSPTIRPFFTVSQQELITFYLNSIGSPLTIEEQAFYFPSPTPKDFPAFSHELCQKLIGQDVAYTNSIPTLKAHASPRRKQSVTADPGHPAPSLPKSLTTNRHLIFALYTKLRAKHLQPDPTEPVGWKTPELLQQAEEAYMRKMCAENNTDYTDRHMAEKWANEKAVFEHLFDLPALAQHSTLSPPEILHIASVIHSVTGTYPPIPGQPATQPASAEE